jgi:hypothetical protein
MVKQQKLQPKYPVGSRVTIVAATDATSTARKNQGKTGRVTSCKSTEHPVVFLYDIVMDADETTLQYLPESCLESKQ